jgi:Cys-rich repeat protein
MVRVLRSRVCFAVLLLLVSTWLVPSGCSGGGSPLVGPGNDASTGSDVTATVEAAAGNDAHPAGCMSNGDCATSTTGHVCASGACVVCAVNADCPTGQKCDAHTSCVACLTSADCSAGQRCVANACAQGCDATSACPAGTVCDTTTSACVGCLLDTDCAAPTPRCNPTGNACVACLTTPDCALGTVCSANACVPGCSATQPCPGGEVCSAAGACIQCTVNSQCHGATPWCDMTQNKCVQCLPSNDSCPTGQYCAGTACAPGCRTNVDCTVLNAAGDGGSDGADDGGADAPDEAATADAGSDGATEGGAGVGGGAICDTTNHACVGCVTDSNCPLGQTCSNNLCVAGCDTLHGCPAGSGCCAGLCQSLNTTSNCTACGATCDTISGNSQGAACSPGGCTYTGCTAGWGDCSSVAPDSNGCETNLTATSEKVCSDGTCVPEATCCTGLDCTTPPAPAACYPAHGACASEGTTCNYAQNTGSVICGAGATCCNAINGTCNSDCSLVCTAGFGHCSADPASGCESNLTTCVNTPCCASGMCNPHLNGLGQTYTDCVDPAGTPGSGSTYTGTMANDAAKAWAPVGTIAATTCTGQSCVTNVSAGRCATWCYTGTLGGHELESANATCTCPTTASGTWK